MTDNSIDELYKELVTDVLKNGEWKENRTGIRTLSKIGAYLKIPVNESFPLLTTKRVFWKSAFAEMLGFIRGYSSAAQFRELGCRVWDKDTNENEDWLKNPERNGDDDAGRIYGVQWRDWNERYDQLGGVIGDLQLNIDSRRQIITAWNPAELHQMCLPPCHMMMQFHLVSKKTVLDLSVTQRSWDVALGCPFNVAQYAFLLYLVAQITKKVPGTLHYHANDVHIYEPHIPMLREQLGRPIHSTMKPKLILNSDDVDSLTFLETTDKPIDEWAWIIDYHPQSPIKMEMYTTPSSSPNKKEV